MKIAIVCSAVVLLLSCGYNQPPAYVQTVPVQQSYPQQGMGYDVLQQNGQQVIYVHNGTEEFFMDYLLFNSLMNNGGWGSVYGRYRSNPSYYYNTNMYNHYHGWSSSSSYSFDRNNRPVRSNTNYWSNRVNNPNRQRVNNTYNSNNRVNSTPPAQNYRSNNNSYRPSSTPVQTTPSRSTYQRNTTSTPRTSTPSSSSRSSSSYRRH